MREAPLLPCLRPRKHRSGRVAPPQQVLGEVEPRLGIPARARHPVAVHENRAPFVPARTLANFTASPKTARDARSSNGRRPDSCSIRASSRGSPGARTREVRFLYALWTRRPERSFGHGGSSRLVVGHYNLRRIALDPDRETHGTRIMRSTWSWSAGAAGLASAIRLKQLAAQKAVELGVCVIEKGSEIGAHILSGAVMDPRRARGALPRL